MSVFNSGILLVPIGIIVITLVVCILILKGWCTCHHWLSHPVPRENLAREKRSAPQNLKPYLLSSFKYKKGIGNAEATSETECVVCLTGFEDDEYVQQLPHCRHSFHASCIDLWLYSHSDCPLCRTPVHRLEPQSTREENSMDGLLDIIVYDHDLELSSPPS